MPYKHRDAYHQAIRDWIYDLRPGDMKNQIGVVSEFTAYTYQRYAEEAGALLDWPNPKKVELKALQWLESQFSGGQSTVFQKATYVRAFFRFAGCRDAWKWRLRVSPSQERTDPRVWLNEQEISIIRRAVAPFPEPMGLLFSLGVDMGLRGIDCARLTVTNAEEFLRSDSSVIIGKGRYGGKKGLQDMNEMTREPLQRWLDTREQMVEASGLPDVPQLLIKEVNYLGHRLKPFDPQHDIRDLIPGLSEHSGIYFRFHDLRATFGNRLYKAGVDLETIAQMMRHESSGVTFKRYIGVDQGRRRDAMRKLCP